MNSETIQFGYDLIRNDVLQDILGKEHDAVLYWIGQSLARKYPQKDNNEMVSFFEKASWGELKLIKEKRNKLIYELTGPWMGKNDKRNYQLEAGFLAKQAELQLNFIAGATYENNKNGVIITVQFDRYDSI